MDYKEFFYDKSKDDFDPSLPYNASGPHTRVTIDNLINSVIWRDSCRVLLMHYDLHGISPIIEAVVDGIVLENNDRVLIINGMYPMNSGIYVANVYPYNRTLYAKLTMSAYDYTSNMSSCTYIQEGEEYADTVWLSSLDTNEWFKIIGASN